MASSCYFDSWMTDSDSNFLEQFVALTGTVRARCVDHGLQSYTKSVDNFVQKALVGRREARHDAVFDRLMNS